MISTNIIKGIMGVGKLFVILFQKVMFYVIVKLNHFIPILFFQNSIRIGNACKYIVCLNVKHDH